MNLIDEIIAALTSPESSLTEALLKTKVLLHKVGHQELTDWVNKELNGYADNDELPKYRILPAQVLANVVNKRYLFNAHPLPIAHLSEENRERLENAKMNHSLAELEAMLNMKDVELYAPIPMEQNGLLGKSLDNGYKIQQAWCRISKSAVTQILIQVRSRLLVFVLGLQDKFGDNLSDIEIKQHAKSFDVAGLFNNSMFGDNTSIIVGSHNKQQVSNIQVRGNFDALSDELKKYRIQEQDISALQSAITEDESAAELGKKKYGPAVKSWLQMMLSKAVDASWQIELGIASSLLATALQKFYGWP